MLDNLYKNIGDKVKGLAQFIFCAEAISAIITGFIMIIADSDLLLYGLLTIICGPIIALLSSWLLYAFGELVEKTCDNENNTRQILKELQQRPVITQKETSAVTTTAPAPTYNPRTHKWMCSGCGNMRTQSPCEHCGQE